MSMNKCLFDLPPHVSLVELSELLGMDDEDEVSLVLEYYGVSVEVVNGVKVARIGKNVVTQPDGKTKVTTKPFIGEFCIFFWDWTNQNGTVGQRVTIAQRPSRRFVNSKIGDAELFEILDGSYQGLAGLIPKPGGYVARPLVGPVTPAIPRKPQFPETPSFPTSQPALDTGSAQSKFSTPINTSSSFNTSALHSRQLMDLYRRLAHNQMDLLSYLHLIQDFRS
ncbi:hypothetical protein BCR33DRAFT_193531 [Rhizoclosmatium globosum]|uniref:Uncharacterized protein n=1 Tax=Rhizoclosmatium globosum TaxID=329046 RepID=A0A1Y2CDV5_9FUNG|nr:hypothetical protein BCR33DRAFT_193531 [Rhizoclosmatium globosum]|eukprot:ORY45106.1 hypothetical protein BCR33DRAFT_193531 [Rhizoclosmatium globosum]